MFKKFLYVVMLLPLTGHSLEIDEKLTLRIVNTSQSAKTILINRGIEDGLVKGDHAKFFLSDGVIGRGVCIKLSPTRSVWSMYRVVNSTFLQQDQVMKLKITPQVKITKDESRMLVSDDESKLNLKDPRDLGIPLAQGADDLEDVSLLDRTRTSVETKEPENVSLIDLNKEIFGMIHYSAYSEKTSPSDDGEEFTSDVTNMLLRIGGEWYFREESRWYNRFSFIGTFTLDRQTILSHLGYELRDESSEFGFGVNLYPSTMPSQVYEVIQYLNYTFTLGSTHSSYSGGRSSSYQDEALDASVIQNSFAYGLKYYTPRGYGARVEMSYVIRGDEYAKDNVSNVSWVKTRIGPRLLMGMSYRF